MMKSRRLEVRLRADETCPLFWPLCSQHKLRGSEVLVYKAISTLARERERERS